MTPLDHLSEVVDTNRRMVPDWYTWLTQLAAAVVTPATTVQRLPSPTLAGAGARGFVTDATTTTFLGVVVGGGTNKVPVVSDGTIWRIG